MYYRGEVQNSKAASTLINMLPSSDYIIADLGYDSEPPREKISDENAIPVIQRKKSSKIFILRLL
ncbi:transposase [Colwellia sp. MB02u-6]|uniref:transposase n=1 Tax=Colwellia sp. MB02u-6 TaxID=2759824 RepID=UPI003855BB2D